MAREIKAELRKHDWEPLKVLVKESPSAAHTLFMDTLIPLRKLGSRAERALIRVKRSKLQRSRKLLWRKHGKVVKKIERVTSLSKLSMLIQDKWELEKQLKEDYSSCNLQEESKAVLNMKHNPKAFFSFARSRKKKKNKCSP